MLETARLSMNPPPPTLCIPSIGGGGTGSSLLTHKGGFPLLTPFIVSNVWLYGLGGAFLVTAVLMLETARLSMNPPPPTLCIPSIGGGGTGSGCLIHIRGFPLLTPFIVSNVWQYGLEILVPVCSM